MAEVVITGIAAISALGEDKKEAVARIRHGEQGLQVMEAWQDYRGLGPLIAAPMPFFERPSHYHRKKVRTMGRVSLLAARACELAFPEAGIDLDNDQDQPGVAFGSGSGSPPAIIHYARQITHKKTLAGVTASEYIKFMSHTVAANLIQFFGIKGRLISCCSGDLSSAMALGLAFEAVQAGKLISVAAGGAEELSPMAAAMYRAQDYYFTGREPGSGILDKQQGTVLGEGAAGLILEAEEHARARGANIYGEILAFAGGNQGDPEPGPASSETMVRVIQETLRQADLQTSDIDLILKTGTGIAAGDQRENHALNQLFTEAVPKISLKPFIGHCQGASSAIEIVYILEALQQGTLIGTQNPDAALTRNPVHLLVHHYGINGAVTALLLRRTS